MQSKIASGIRLELEPVAPVRADEIRVDEDLIHHCRLAAAEHYNQVRLHSAIGYVAPADKLAAHETEIFTARDRKLAEARERRKTQREQARLQTVA